LENNMATARNRVIYAGTNILVSDCPSWANQTGISSLRSLNRVQSSSISIQTPVSRSKQLGSFDYTFQKYLTYPKITTKVNYYLTDNTNELVLNLITNGQTGAFYNLAESQKDINLFYVLTNNNAEDFTDIGSLSGYNIFGVGNAFLTNYSIEASVGNVPSASVEFDCVNILFQNYTGCLVSGSTVLGGTVLPAIDLTGGYKSTGVYLLNPFNFNSANYISNQFDRPAALRYGDLILQLQQPLIGGIRYSGTVQANITSFNVSLPLERRDLLGFGNNFPFDKRLIFPIIGTLSFEGIFDSAVTGDFSQIFDDENKYSFDFTFKNCNNEDQLKIGIDNAMVETQSLNLSIEENMSFSSSFSFEVSDKQGFTISGAAQFITGDLMPSINNQTLALL